MVMEAGPDPAGYRGKVNLCHGNGRANAIMCCGACPYLSLVKFFFCETSTSCA